MTVVHSRPADGDKKPAPPRGVVTVRVQGHPEDFATFVAQLVELGARHAPQFAYRDRNGVTIRRYLTATVRKAG
jgi:hypothetical protein